MDNIVFEALGKYFKHLCNAGYLSQSNVDKLVLLVIIQELIDNDFRGLITEEDYNEISKALYCLYGSSCLIPYPDYYNNKNRRVMYIGSISELAHRVETLETIVEEGGSGGGAIIKDKQIVVPTNYEYPSDNNTDEDNE